MKRIIVLISLCTLIVSFGKTQTNTVYQADHLIFCFQATTPQSYIDSLLLLYNATQVDSTSPSNCRLWHITFPVIIPGQSNPLISIQEIKAHSSSQTEIEAVGENYFTKIPPPTQESICPGNLPYLCPGDTNKILLALIDTGIDVDHPYFSNGDHFWSNEGEIAGNGLDDDANGYVDDVAGYDFVEQDPIPQDLESHGTHLAGIIIQMINAAESAAVKIINLKTQDEHGDGTVFLAIKASDYAIVKGAAVLNMSLTYAPQMTHLEADTITPPLRHAIAIAASYDALVVAAAGNDGLNIDQDPYYPAAFEEDNIIAVAAIDCAKNLAGFSNYGPEQVDLAALGVDIYSTVPPGSHSTNQNGTLPTPPGWAYKSGTSMAAAFVSAAAAIVKTQDTLLTYPALKTSILSTVTVLPSLNGWVLTSGELNTDLLCTIHLLREAPIANPESTDKATLEVFPNPFNDTWHLKVLTKKAVPMKMQLSSLLGHSISARQLLLEAGEYTWMWQEGHLPPGIYLLRVDIGEAVFFEKLVKK